MKLEYKHLKPFVQKVIRDCEEGGVRENSRHTVRVSRDQGRCYVATVDGGRAGEWMEIAGHPPAR